MNRAMISRRRLIATGASGLMLAGCDRLNNSQSFRGVLRSAEKLTMGAQRLIRQRDALAREYSEADLSPIFRPNGTRMPGSGEYAQHLAERHAIQAGREIVKQPCDRTAVERAEFLHLAEADGEHIVE